MEKLVRVPFDLETAKKIQNGEVEGKIVTRDGRSARIVCWDKRDNLYPILALTNEPIGTEEIFSFSNSGKEFISDETDNDLFLEVPEYIKCVSINLKPFDRVLVRVGQVWTADLFSHMENDVYVCVGSFWRQCIPYEGNEHLLGTTEKPEDYGQQSNQ